MSNTEYPEEYNGLRLVNHGGKCCGIKTIYGFGQYPDDTSDSLPTLVSPNNLDIMYGDVSSNGRFFHLSAPEETTKHRLDRYIEYVRELRPKHVIEAVLYSNSHRHAMCQEAWFPVLEDRGFKEVTAAENCNSGNTIHIFHLVISEPIEEEK